ncbi:heterokaryon incompatibility protein-domain-containing protein [Xylogone sp. PMI_703]|nr:heterokaryon incompatibility protein-domain-containing protein [Xylogone sp. PMI_703]
MRLLNTTTLELEDSFENTPEYAILSHKWTHGEVSFSDMQNGRAQGKPGYSKIKSSCEQALKDELQHIWIDTCCIDKSSSAELTEAINSMYQWYRNAKICYAYMFDVQGSEAPDNSSFNQSVWFTRGWTLQELIAPVNVIFFNSEWACLGSKSTLKTIITVVTGIELSALDGTDPENFSIAKRMSWASKRTTTRVEDLAYSLLGIFGVNMPMLYGEGERAFLRLQEEILKHSDDQSLFAWKKVSNDYQGLLASSPSDFAGCENIISSPSKWNRIPYSITNMGLSIQMPMIPWAMETYFAALDCQIENAKNSRIGIFLKLMPEVSNQYVRILLEDKDRQTFEISLAAKAEFRNIYVRQNIRVSPPEIDRMYGFWIRTLPGDGRSRVNSDLNSDLGDKRFEVTSWNNWSEVERILKIPIGANGTAGAIWHTHNGRGRTLKVGFDNDFNPVCQYGGHLLCGSGLYGTKTFEGLMDPSWMYQKSEYVHRGDRISGLNSDNYPWNIHIEEHIIRDERAWVLDITDWGSDFVSNEADYICDECERKITGIRFRCTVCPDFDYCDRCIIMSSITHKEHEFRVVEA